MKVVLRFTLIILCVIMQVSLLFAQQDSVVLYHPIQDVSIVKGDTLDLYLPDSTFYERNGKQLVYSAFFISNNNATDLPVWVSQMQGAAGLKIKPVGISSGNYDFIIVAAGGTASAADTFQVSVINDVPKISDPLSGLILSNGFGTTTINVSGNFIDVGGDNLSFSASSGNTSVATVSVSGAVITIREVGSGRSQITVTARDSDGASIADKFTVIVREENQVFTFTAENTGTNSLVDSWIKSIHIEGDDEIWIGTQQGVSILAPSTGAFRTELRKELGHLQELL